MTTSPRSGCEGVAEILGLPEEDHDSRHWRSILMCLPGVHRLRKILAVMILRPVIGVHFRASFAGANLKRFPQNRAKISMNFRVRYVAYTEFIKAMELRDAVLEKAIDLGGQFQWHWPIRALLGRDAVIELLHRVGTSIGA